MFLSRHLTFALTLWAIPVMFAQVDPRVERIRHRQEEFYQQRASPRTSIPAGARAAAIAEMERMIARERKASPHAAGPVWTSIGPRPTNVLAENGPIGGGSPYSSGRVAALAVDPRNPDVAYTRAAGGGCGRPRTAGQTGRR